MKILYIDTACSAFQGRSKDAPPWEPHCVRIAALLEDGGEIVGSMTHLIKPPPLIASWALSEDAVQYHRATQQDFTDHGVALTTVAVELTTLLQGVDLVVSHSATFHTRMLKALFYDAGAEEPSPPIQTFCTMLEAAPICQLKLVSAGRWKATKLSEAYLFFTASEMDPAGTWSEFAEEQVDAVRAVYHGIKKTMAAAA